MLLIDYTDARVMLVCQAEDVFLKGNSINLQYTRLILCTGPRDFYCICLVCGKFPDYKFENKICYQYNNTWISGLTIVSKVALLVM